MVTTCFSLFYDYEKKCSELDLTSVHVEMNKKVITVFLDTNNTSYDITVTFILSISINIFYFFYGKILSIFQLLNKIREHFYLDWVFFFNFI